MIVLPLVLAQLAATSSLAWPQLDVGVAATFAGGAYVEARDVERVPRHHAAEDPRGTGFDAQRLELFLASRFDVADLAIALAVPHAAGLRVDEAALSTRPLPGGFRVRGGVLRSAIVEANRRHLHHEWFARRPALYAALLGPNGLVAPGAQLWWEACGCLPVAITAIVEALSVGRDDDPALPAQTFGGGGADDPTLTGSLKVRGGTERLAASGGLSYAAGRLYFPDRALRCTVAGAVRDCPTARAHVAGGFVTLTARPAALVDELRWTTELQVRRVPRYDLTGGVLYTELRALVTPAVQLGLRWDAVGLPSDAQVLRRSHVLAASAAWLPAPFLRLRVHVEGDLRPQALKRPEPPAEPENDALAVFLQAELTAGRALDWE